MPPDPRLRSTSRCANAYTYRGRYLDAETDLYYYRHRIYHSQLGRFGSRDPIAYKDGWSVYSYVDSCPTVQVDPSGRGIGLVPVVGGGAKAGVGGAVGGPIGIGIGAGAGLGYGIYKMPVVGTEHWLEPVLEDAFYEIEDTCRSVFCRHRHPTWTRCGTYPATPSGAVAQALTSPNTLLDEVGYDPGEYVWVVGTCRDKGPAEKCPGAAPGRHYQCAIQFINSRLKVRVFDLGVNCCRCCWRVTSGISCRPADHWSGDLRKKLPPGYQDPSFPPHLNARSSKQRFSRCGV